MPKTETFELKKLRQSFLGNYLLCPTRAFKDAEIDTDALSADHQKFGNTIHEMARMAAQTGRPTDVKKSFLKIAKKFGLTALDYLNPETQRLVEEWFERLVADLEEEEIGGIEDRFDVILNGVPCTGTVDRWGWRKVEKKKRLRISDYKTNRVPYTRDEVENSVQFNMYAAYLFQKFPDVKEIDVVYDLVRFGHFAHTITRDENDQFLDWLSTMWDIISQDKTRIPKLNKYCSWCNHKMTCPAFINLMKEAGKGGIVIPAVVNPANVHEWQVLFDSLEGLKASKKMIEKRVEEIEQIFRIKIADDGEIPLEDGGEIYLSTNPRNSYPAYDVYKALKSIGKDHFMPEIVTIGKEKLDRIAANHPDVAKAIDGLMQVEYVKPTLKSRKGKK